MNRALNPLNKPYTVIEGLVDSDTDFNDSPKQIKREKVCVYAGSINKKYGIDKLVYAFAKIKQNGYELHIYGGGDFENELLQICKEKNNIKFMGWRSNDEITKTLSQSALLINPRPSGDEYTKYSFPSKTMEYMLSTTPFLTTKLPGIPAEYFSNLYLFDDESIDGMAKIIDSILIMSEEVRLKKASDAFQFIVKNKNNIIQTNKIISMLEFQTNS